jgi:hypothetical protein
MNWGKSLIIVLGLMQLPLIVHARDIESFTDSQGVLHITNSGTKQPDSPANPPSPAAPRHPSRLPSKAPSAQTAREPAPQAHAPGLKPVAPAPVPNSEAQAPAPAPEAAPAGPVPVDPQPGSRVTHPEGSGGVMPMANRTGNKARLGGAAETPDAPLQRVSWSPPQPVMPSSEGKIVIRRDRQGVIHITNVAMDDAPVIAPAPAAPRPAVQRPARASAVILPAVQTVSCPELGPEVAAYLEAKLQSHSPVWFGRTLRRYRDPQGVWHIVDAPAPDVQSPEGPLVASAGQIATPAAAHNPPVTPTPPAMALGPGFVEPSSGSGPMVVAQRDQRGVVHIFSRASAEGMADRNSPVSFLRRVSPAVQSCIIEAAGMYQLPIPLVLALIRQESNFAHQAVSPKGAMGLMQLMPGTAASLGVQNPFDPRENILAGCRYFRQLLDYFQGNVPLALAGYNAGYHRVISAGCQIPAIKETQEFVTQVMGLYCLLEKRASGL